MLKNRNKQLIVLLFAGFATAMACNQPAGTANKDKTDSAKVANADSVMFVPPDTSQIPHTPEGDLIRYGRELVLHTAQYLGPQGTVGHYLGNKMNCTNCHLDGGTRPFGYNYFSTHGRYPQFRGRENEILTLEQRINNCVERPHNGKPLPLDSKEVIAIASYVKWVSTGVPNGKHVYGDGALELKYPDRAADVHRGEQLFMDNCSSCHGKDGQGSMTADTSTYVYPPLWGPHSFQKGSSPHRVLKMARFVKAWPILTDEEVIDICAFVNDDRIHSRPEKRDKSKPDYPDPKVKPIDYGTGPYSDTFSEFQHKFGPYQPIVDYHKAHNLPVIF